MNLLIKNARIVDAAHDFHGDVYIENGKIKEISDEIAKGNVEVIDAEGKTLMPAFIDTHTHFRDPGLTYKEDIETGSKAAVRGGYTGVCLMANTKPIVSDKETLEYIRNRGKEVGLVDLHQCVSVTKDFDGVTLEHLEAFKGDKNLKAISDDGKGVVSNETMRRALELTKETGWVVMSHAECPEFSKLDMRLAEDMMTIRDVELAKYTKGRLHMCHVSTVKSMEAIIDAKMEGANVTCEVTPHHIFLTQDVSNYRVNPPIREKEDVEYLHWAIKHGFVDCIGTDHAPHTEEDKKNGSPGMVGLETAFPICYTSLVKDGNITLNKLSEIMSKNGAKLLGMNKGTIEIGKDGDLVLVDLDKKIKVDSSKFASKGKNTPYEGMEFYGEILMTVKSGKIVYKK
ncbi:MAG: dihydroorotase [Clostridium sp.]|uniref:dihydroorotase n=1 Tax=Clostridium sp. DSM 8431 TaxID=1761781 RepID=UPI0008EE4675|nr:dihydroorotase [Clostridium sp. DSM 8431]MCR4944282.1 dihydroorotase [Clostridium sp.]SFU72312.1 dihydroorotase [Clostridium sp. DSM 8431]